MQYIGDWPQMAYVQDRSTGDALRRVFRNPNKNRYELLAAHTKHIEGMTGQLRGFSRLTVT